VEKWGSEGIRMAEGIAPGPKGAYSGQYTLLATKTSCSEVARQTVLATESSPASQCRTAPVLVGHTLRPPCDTSKLSQH